MLYFSNISFYETFGDLFTKDDLNLWINVEKLTSISSTVLTLKNLQTCSYSFQEVSEIQNHILKYQTLSVKEAEGAVVRLKGNK